MASILNAAGLAARPATTGAAAPGSSASGDFVKNGSTATFMEDVIDASHDTPVVVDFWAPWCGPCKTLGPALEKAVSETKGAVRMVKINVDENQDLAAQMRVQSIPAVYAFKNGRPVDGFVGALPDSQIKAFVKRLGGNAPAAPAGLAEALQQAKAALAEGDVGTALTFYTHILQREPANPEALAGLGRSHLVKGDIAKARQVLEQIPAELAKHADVVALKTTLDLAAEAAGKGSVKELAIKLQASPADHQVRYDLAMARFSAGDREGAVDDLLEIIRRERGWNEEAARKQLVKLFEAFGPTDPLTVQSRRKLSSILFS